MHTASSEYAQPRTSTYFLTVKKLLGKKKEKSLQESSPLARIYSSCLSLSANLANGAWHPSSGDTCEINRLSL